MPIIFESSAVVSLAAFTMTFRSQLWYLLPIAVLFLKTTTTRHSVCSFTYPCPNRDGRIAPNAASAPTLPLSSVTTAASEWTATGEEALQYSKTGLSIQQTRHLDHLLEDTLYRIVFLMEHTEKLVNDPGYASEAVQHNDPTALRVLLQTCQETVHIGTSTIPNAGRGLFASQDIPKGTIVSWYPIHAIGCRFENGACQSVQLNTLSSNGGDNSSKNNSPAEPINLENSAYTLLSMTDAPLLGIDIANEFPDGPRIFVDMNPSLEVPKGWYCGYINDAATVQHDQDPTYYPISKGKQNVEIVPFGVQPFQVGVTTKDVVKGEELFVSYGYNYWRKALHFANNGNQQKPWEPLDESILSQEEDMAEELSETIQYVQEHYAEASGALAELFLGLGPLPSFGQEEKEDNELTMETTNSLTKKSKREKFALVWKKLCGKLSSVRP